MPRHTGNRGKGQGILWKDTDGEPIHAHRGDILFLYGAGMADKVCRYFQELTAEPGAVRRTLEKHLD